MIRTLYGKLALVLLGLFAVLTVACLVVNLWTTQRYLQEANQELHHDLASYLLQDKTLMLDGEIQQAAKELIFDRLMVINPSIECYLLDPAGQIITFSAPDEKIKRERIDLGPLETFIRGDQQLPIFGDDPRDASGRKVFSVAKIKDGNDTGGYLYVVLQGEKYDGVFQMMGGSYILRLGSVGVGLSLLAGLLAALLLFNVMTRRLKLLAGTMEQFQAGGFTEQGLLSGSYEPDSGNEIDRLGSTFQEMASRMVDQVDSLKEADRLRRELIANVSHDLRTPLTTLQGYLETLQLKGDTLPDADKQRYLEIATRHSERLSKLVAELFELAKLDSYRIEMHSEPCAIGELAQDVVQKFQLVAEQKSVTLLPKLNRNLPFVSADVSLLERVLENLIDNALQHTEAGGEVTVRVGIQGDSIRVEVKDTGCGIDQQEIPHLFERFYRVRKGEHGSASGAGLGLAITKKILELHGTEIAVESQVGVGTTFAFDLRPAA